MLSYTFSRCVGIYTQTETHGGSLVMIWDDNIQKLDVQYIVHAHQTIKVNIWNYPS